MLRIKIELIPGGIGEPEMIGCMDIARVAQRSKTRRDYKGIVYRRGAEPGRKASVLRQARVDNYPFESYNVWRLITRMLKSAFPEEADHVEKIEVYRECNCKRPSESEVQNARGQGQEAGDKKKAGQE